MALQSMTGFGRGTAIGAGLSLSVEITTVNRKQLDVRVSLPSSLSALEPQVLSLVRKRVRRGSVSCNVRAKPHGTPDRGAVEVDLSLAKGWLHELRKTGKALNLKDDLGLRSLLTLPDVVRLARSGDDPELVRPVLRKALNQALSELVTMRTTEGATLSKDLLKRIKRLTTLVSRIEKNAGAVPEHYRLKLMARLKSAGLPVDLSDARILKEVALFAERADISEEVVRLSSHMDQVCNLLSSKGEVGRALDFLCQEMLREINTIGSKANDVTISKSVIRFKTDLESVREQVQNLE